DEARILLALHGGADPARIRGLGRGHGRLLYPRRAAPRHARGLAQCAGGGLNGVDDMLVARAPAEVAFEPVPDLLLARVGLAREQLTAGHDHARGAEPALEAVLRPERVLEGVQLAVLSQSLDRRHLGAVGLDRQHGAGLDGLAVDEDSAGAADAR